MKSNNSLKKYYKEQYDAYPTLSQEEIESLYESEGITKYSPEELLIQITNLINEKENELSLLQSNNIEDEFISSNFTNENKEQQDTKARLTNQDKIEELKNELFDLKNQADKLKRSYKNIAHKLFISTRRFLPRERAYPSNELRNKIVCGNLQLAKILASKYYHKEKNSVPYDDLFQIACEALMSAAHYYVPNDTAKFTTYASRCIENKLKREVYKKHKMRKLQCKPEEFFQKEKDQIKYIKTFLNSGFTRYYSIKEEENVLVALHRFREEIRLHNRHMKKRGELNRLLSSFSGPRTDEKLDILVQKIMNLIKNSKMNILIDDEDKELANLIVNYQNRHIDTIETYQLLYYIDRYLYKLDLVEKYLEVENDLISQNNGITPTDEEILKELNRRIRLINREKTALKKEGFYDRNAPTYNRRYNYYNVYRELYKVDPFITSEEYEWDEFSSKQKERNDIVDDLCGEEIDSLTFTINDMINDINKCDCEYVVLFFVNEDSPIYNDWKVVEEDEEYDEEYGDLEIYQKEEAIERLNKLVQELPNIVETHVKKVLQERKDKVNAILEEKNAPLIKKDKELAPLIDKYHAGAKHQKLLNEGDLLTVKQSIQLLFADDIELFILMNSSKEKTSYKQSGYSEVEKEALDNLFLSEYYKALNELPELERDVLLRYFDESGVHSMTAKEIGSELNLTPSQVYQVKTKALRKLSLNPRLKSYIE